MADLTLTLTYSGPAWGGELVRGPGLEACVAYSVGESTLALPNPNPNPNPNQARLLLEAERTQMEMRLGALPSYHP